MLDVTELARPCILNRKEYVPGKPIEEVQREYGITDIIKMASNENPLGTSPLALRAMIDELKQNACRYPVSLCTDLASRLALEYQLTPDQIFIDNGIDGVITMIGLTFINPGEEVVYGQLSFPAYGNITGKMVAYQFIRFRLIITVKAGDNERVRHGLQAFEKGPQPHLVGAAHTGFRWHAVDFG